MASVSQLSDSEITARAPNVPEWKIENGGLNRDFKFSDFISAFGFMTSVAIHAEKMNHHPEWSNVYASVSIRLSTHDVGGISVKDFELAERIDQIAARML